MKKFKEFINEGLLSAMKPKSEEEMFKGLDKNNTLYHGTNIKNLKDIEKYGLLPDFGDTVKGTEMYEYYMDDNYIDSDDRVDGVIFFSDNKDTWSYSNFGSDANIDDAILVAVENNDTIYRKVGDGFYDFNGDKVDSIDYIDEDKLPFFIESGDYFSFEEQTPIIILYGEQLKKFIKRN